MTYPKSWAQTTLGEVIPYGEAPKVEPSNLKADDWVLELEDVEKDSSRLISRFTFSERESKSTKSRFKKGDVLYGKLRPYLNKVLIACEDGYCTTEIIPIDCPDGLENRFLFYWLKSPHFLEYVNAISHGMHMPRLGTEAAKAAPFIVAPEAEQRRIADKLDQTLAVVERARERLARVPEILKRFRQSVLAAATDGRLTADWRSAQAASAAAQEAQSAYVARDAAQLVYAVSLETPNKSLEEELPWVAMPLGELLSDGPQNGLYKHSSHYGSGTRILRIDAFYDGKIVSLEKLKRLQVTENELGIYSLTPGDIVINRVNSPEYLGKSALISELPEPVVFESNMMRIQLDLVQILPEYCILTLNSPVGIERLRSNAKHAVNQSSINQTDVKRVLIPLPPLPEQTEIVRRVEALFALAERIEARYQAALGRVEKLSAALLAKAFRGELVAQDPNDEPAQVLLERLRAARALSTPSARPGRRRQAG